MRPAFQSRAYWLVPCALVGALLAVLPQGARSADDPRAWLEKMNKALATRNYDGTFFHISGGRVETMRIVHRVRAGRVSERLQSLDGSRREFVRANDELTCYLPDQHTVLVEPRQDRGPFLGSLPQFDQSVGEFYRIESLPSERILGRPARVITVNPKDQYRFGYRLWLDEKTAMPLKTQLCDPQGKIIEQIFFARLDMPENIPDSDLSPTVRTEGMRWVRQGPSIDSASAALADYRASQLPPGFRLTVQGAQTLGGASAPASHLVYSDGLATVSVFVEEQRGSGADPGVATPGVAAPGVAAPGVASGVATPGVATPGVYLEPDAPAPMQGLARVGSGYAYSTVVQGHQVTAVGEVPAQTVEFIAHSVKIYGGAEIPRR
jgi:sigma-E factor negative regulatory protein RseB